MTTRLPPPIVEPRVMDTGGILPRQSPVFTRTDPSDIGLQGLSPVKSGLVKNLKQTITPVKAASAQAPTAGGTTTTRLPDGSTMTRINTGAQSGVVSPYNPEGREIITDALGRQSFGGLPGATSTGMGWEKYATPIGDGFTGVRNGQNFVNGHVFAAEGLNQGDANNPLGTGFGNWLAAHKDRLGGTAATYQIPAKYQNAQLPVPAATPTPTNPIARPNTPDLPATGKPARREPPPPVVTNVGFAQPPAASNRPTISPNGTVNANRAPSNGPATQPPGPLTTVGFAQTPATSNRPTLTPRTTRDSGALKASNVGLGTGDSLNESSLAGKAHLFADGGRVSKRRRRKPETAFSRPLPMEGQDMTPMTFDQGTMFDPWAASRAAARFQDIGLEPFKPRQQAVWGAMPADFGPLAPEIPPSQGPGVRPADFGPFAPQPPVHKPRAPADFGPLPPKVPSDVPGLKPAWRPGMPMPELIGYGYGKPSAATAQAGAGRMGEQSMMPMDARILDSGEVVGRDDQRFFGEKPGAMGMTPVPDANQGQPFDPWARSRAMADAQRRAIPDANQGQQFDPWARSRAMSRAPMAEDIGLEAAPLTRIEQARPFTNGYADGGRVDKTSHHGSEIRYADGGKVTPFEITYEDYLRLNSATSGSETGSQSPISRAEWDALPEAQRWVTMGGTLRITPDDPRFAALNAQVGDPREPNRNITISVGDPDQIYQPDWIHDPNRIARGNGWYAISDTNFTPDFGRAEETRTRRNMQQAAIAAAALVAGGTAYNAFGTAGTAAGEGIGLTAEGAAGVGTVPGAGTAGGTVGPAAGITGGTGAIDVSALAANPAVQSAASSAGQTVGQWLSNPTNLMTAARIAGTVGSLIAGGSNGSSGQVPPIPGAGTPIPGGTGTGVTVPGATVAPGGGASGYTEEPLDPAFLESLNPANFQGSPADLANWQEARGRFRPLEDVLFGEAMTAGNADEQEAAAGRAGADVEQAFSSASKQARDRMVQQGLNPDTGGAGIELARLTALDKAKAAAGSKNIARRGEKDRGYAVRAHAAGIGNAISGQALSADNIGLQYDMGNRRMALDAAGRYADLGYRAHEGRADRSFRGSENAADREFRSGESAADRTWRSGESAAERELRRQGLNAQIEAGNFTRNRLDQQDRGRGIGQAIGTGLDIYRAGRDFGWWGGDASNAAGAAGDGVFDWGLAGYADGGRVDASEVGLENEEMPATPKKKKRRDYRDGARVEGAGSSTSDSIRARLSDGEGVLNAEAMEMMDEMQPGMLDEMNAKGLALRKMRKHMERQLREFDPMEVGL